MRVKVDLDEPGAPLGDYDRLILGGALDEELAGDYNNAQF